MATINVPVRVKYNPNQCLFHVSMTYLSSTTIRDLLIKSTEILNDKLGPKQWNIYELFAESFTGHWNCSWPSETLINKCKDLCVKSLTEYNLDEIKNKGLVVNIINQFEHKINKYDIKITCPHIKNKNNMDPLQCPIYKSMKKYYIFSENNLKHLNEFIHFTDELNQKQKCKYGQQCKAFIRQENGASNRLDDICHLKIFNHPPRSDRCIQLANNVNPFLFKKKQFDCAEIHEPTQNDKIKYKYNDTNGYLNALIEEVIKNKDDRGISFKYDLCLICKRYQYCNHNVYQSNDKTLLSIVNKKINEPRHIKMGKPLSKDLMLAVILYTGGYCNYDLCKYQRNGDYNKWKFFDYCLYQAIWKLDYKEIGSYKIYSGLRGVKLNIHSVYNGFFPTYTSTTWIKDITKSFMGGNGMILEIDSGIRKYYNCCDVSWISKFPDEFEVLIARTRWSSSGIGFSLRVLDEIKGVQRVCLSYKSLMYSNTPSGWSM